MGPLCGHMVSGEYEQISSEALEADIIEALRRCTYKFPGRQHLIISNRWGFTDIVRADYKKLREQGRLEDCGTHVRIRNGKGPLTDSDGKVLPGSILTF